MPVGVVVEYEGMEGPLLRVSYIQVSCVNDGPTQLPSPASSTYSKPGSPSVLLPLTPFNPLAAPLLAPSYNLSTSGLPVSTSVHQHPGSTSATCHCGSTLATRTYGVARSLCLLGSTTGGRIADFTLYQFHHGPWSWLYSESSFGSPSIFSLASPSIISTMMCELLPSSICF